MFLIFFSVSLGGFPYYSTWYLHVGVPLVATIGPLYSVFAAVGGTRTLPFQIALLRYNSHTVQFTQFKVYNSVALNVFRELYIHHMINFRTFSLTQKEILCPLIITPRISPSFLFYPTLPSPRQPLIYFLSL